MSLTDNHYSRSWPFILSLIMGLLYLAVGVISFLVGIGILPELIGFGDPIGSIMVIIVGVVYISAGKPLVKGQEEGYAFTIVATTLALVLFALQTVIMLTNAIGWFLALDDWITWNIISDITPPFWLFLLVLALIGILRATKRIGGQKGIFPVGM